DLIFFQKPGHGLIHLPFIPVPRETTVEKHLPVVHIQHGMRLLAVISRRQPDPDRAWIYVVRRKVVEYDQLARSSGVGRCPAGDPAHQSGQGQPIYPNPQAHYRRRRRVSMPNTSIRISSQLKSRTSKSNPKEAFPFVAST